MTKNTVSGGGKRWRERERVREKNKRVGEI